MKKIYCPECGSDKSILQVYGLLGPDGLDDERKEYYKVRAMGCKIGSDAYLFVCEDCSHKWNKIGMNL